MNTNMLTRRRRVVIVVAVVAMLVGAGLYAGTATAIAAASQSSGPTLFDPRTEVIETFLNLGEEGVQRWRHDHQTIRTGRPRHR